MIFYGPLTHASRELCARLGVDILPEGVSGDLPLTVEECEGESFVFSSKDTCMIRHIPELMESGIDSFKIEGRMKSAYYAAVVTNTYRMAMDAYQKGNYVFDERWQRELESVSHREYATGYYFSDSREDANLTTIDGYIKEKAYLATVVGYDPESGEAEFVQKNKFVAVNNVCFSAVYV